MSYRSLTLLFVGSTLLALSGCRNDGLVSLDGMVTIDGEPAPEGIGLQFTPISGGSPSYAQTDATGKYVAVFTFKRAGIEVGEHRVQLMPGGGGESKEEMPRAGGADDNSRGPTSKPNSTPPFPKSYYQEIMKIKVENKHNTINIPLKSSGSSE